MNQVFLYGLVKVTHLEKGTFKVNGQCLKLYLRGKFENLARQFSF